MKLSQSAPPMKRNKIPQETLRLFTPYYSDLSETLRLEEKKLIRLINYKIHFFLNLLIIHFSEINCIVNYVVFFGYYDVWVDLNGKNRLVDVGILLNGKYFYCYEYMHFVLLIQEDN
jgi:hypothetical protein